MNTSQDYNKEKLFFKLSFKQRIFCLAVFIIIAGIFFVLNLSAEDTVDLAYWLGVCGFKRNTGLPCPTCGITTSAVLFSRGRIVSSFYTQPAGGLICIMLVIMAILSFIGGVFGVYFNFIYKFWKSLKLHYLVLFFVVIFLLGWLVTLSRTLTNK